MYNFEEILNRSNNGSMKWDIDYIKKRFPGVKEKFYPFFIADMDYRLPNEIISSFNNFVDSGDFGYFHVGSDFTESIINWYEKMQNIILKGEWIIPGIGTITSINFILSALLEKKDSTLIFTPVYGPFRDIIENNELKLIKYQLDMVHGEYSIDFNELKNRIIKEDVKCILFCSPHNPSGRVWRECELNKLIELCKKYNVLLIVDEVHSDLILEDDMFISMSKYFIEYENIVISSSPNKSFNLAGLNASYLIVGNENNRTKISEILAKNKLTPNRVGINVLTSCYTLGEPWVISLRKNIKENYEIANKILKKCDMDVIKPKAGYLLWVKLNKIDNIEQFVIDLARETGVLLEPGKRFVDNYKGYVRINLATSKSILIEGMDKFADYYNNK